MKRAIISAALVLMIVAALAALLPTVNAEELPHGGHCVCGGNCDSANPQNGHTCQAVSDWTPLTSSAFTSKKFSGDAVIKDGTYSYIKPGSYYLTDDYEISKTYYILPGDIVNICLNGHQLRGACRLFGVNGTLNISDCQGGGSVFDSRTGKSFGLAYLYSGGWLNLYGGTVSQADNLLYDPADNLSGRPYGVIVVGNGDAGCRQEKAIAGGLRMFGGEILGTPVAPGSINGSSGGGMGSAIEVFHSCCTVELLGGRIVGNTAKSGGILYASNGTLRISDMVLEGGTATDNGGAIYAGGTATITNSTISGGSAAKGGNIYAASSSELTITGSTVTGGYAKEGGNIAVYGNLTIQSSTVSGGKANSNGGNIASYGNLTIQSSTVSLGEATGNGGNLHMYKNASCLVRDSEILCGLGNRGGNINIGSQDTDNTAHTILVVQDSRILDGLARFYGGNLHMINASDVILRNTEMCNGVAIAGGGNIFDRKNTAYAEDTEIEWVMTGPKLTLDGGTIYGGISASGHNAAINGGNLILEGDLKVDDGNSVALKNLKLSESTAVDFSGLTAGAQVGVSGARDEALQTGLPYSVKELIHYDDRSYYITVEEGGALRTRSAEEHYHCICGGADPDHDHVDVAFSPLVCRWNSLDESPSSGNYYLTADKKSGEKTFSSGDVVLCLNGHSVASSAGRALQVLDTAKLTLCDHVGTGILSAAGSDKHFGGVAFVKGADAELTAYGITLSALSPSSGNTGNAAKGGVLGVSSGGTVKLHSCTVKDGRANYGGNIFCADGTSLTLAGNTSILNGYCAMGGSADGLAAGGAKLDLSGCLVIDSADNTDLYLAGTQTTLHGLTTDDTFRVGVGASTEAIHADQDYSAAFLSTSASKMVEYSANEGLIRIGKPTVALCTGGTEVSRHVTVGSAAQRCGENSYVKLLADTREDALCSKDLYLDTNGFTLSGTVNLSGHTLYGMDSLTDGFNGNRAGAVTAAVSGTVATTCRLPKAMLGNVMRYVAIPAYDVDGQTVLSYSFHRFYIGVTAMTLNPETVSVGYRAAFAGDDAVYAYMDESEAIGFQVWAKTASGQQTEPVTLTQTRAQLQAGQNIRTLWIANMMSEGDDARNTLAATTRVYARTRICLGGETIYGDSYAYTLAGMLATANDLYGTQSDPYTAAEKQQLKLLCTKYGDYMRGWKIDNILAYED